MPRSAISNASSPEPSIPSARASSASVPSNPASRPASPSWTRCRTRSCATAPGATSSPARASAGDRDMLALLETGVRPNDLDRPSRSSAATRTSSSPRATPCVRTRRRPGRRWRSSGRSSRSTCPQTHRRRDTTCKIQKAAREFQRQLRVVAQASSTARGHRRPARRRGTASRRSSRSGGRTPRREAALKATDRAAARRFLVERPSTPYLSQWRQYVYRLSVTLLTRARDHAAARAPPPQLAELRRPAEPDREGAARERRRSAARCSRSTGICSWTSSRTPIPSRPRSCSCWRPTSRRRSRPSDSAVSASAQRRFNAGKARRPSTHRGLARPVATSASRRAVRRRRSQSSRSTASAAPTSRSTTPSATRFSDPAVGRVVSADDELPLGAGAVRLGEQRVRRRGSRPSRRCTRPASRRSIRRRTTARRSRRTRRRLFTLTHSCDEPRRCRQDDAAAIARYIRSEVDAGRRKYSDFLILTRKKKAASRPYASALEELNIPIEVSGAGAFGESAEVEALTVCCARWRIRRIS